MDKIPASPCKDYLDLSQMHLRNLKRMAFSELPGFDKARHFVPEKIHPASEAWALSLLAPALEEEWQRLYERVKAALGLRRREIQKTFSLGEAILEVAPLQFHFRFFQDPLFPRAMRLEKKLFLRQVFFDQPAEDLLLLSQEYPELVIPLLGSWDFDELVDRFETLVEKKGGSLQDNDREKTIEYFSPSGKLFVSTSLQEQELVVRSSLASGAKLWLQVRESNILHAFLPE